VSVPGEFNQSAIVYVTDGGIAFSISQKRSNALAVGNTLTTRGNAQGTPERWRLRYIIAVTIYGGRFYKRRIHIGSVRNPVFTGDRSTITLDGTIWKVTGRHGESSRG
jgi:hypothetical protein